MAVARVTEITSASPESFEDAIRAGVQRASETLRNLQSAWVQEMTVDVNGGSVREYRVNMKVTFLLDN